MEQIREELEKISLKVCWTKELAKLIEELFSNLFDEDDLLKNQLLCTLMVKNMQSINENIQSLLKQTFKSEQI